MFGANEKTKKSPNQAPPSKPQRNEVIEQALVHKNAYPRRNASNSATPPSAGSIDEADTGVVNHTDAHIKYAELEKVANGQNGKGSGGGMAHVMRELEMVMRRTSINESPKKAHEVLISDSPDLDDTNSRPRLSSTSPDSLQSSGKSNGQLSKTNGSLGSDGQGEPSWTVRDTVRSPEFVHKPRSLNTYRYPQAQPHIPEIDYSG